MTKRANPGWFKKGIDHRRHELTKAERDKGINVQAILSLHLGLYYRKSQRSAALLNFARAFAACLD